MQLKQNKILNKFKLPISIILFFTLALALTIGERLPIVDNDENNWGTILNNFLGVSHTENGSLKNISVYGTDGNILATINNDNGTTFFTKVNATKGLNITGGLGVSELDAVNCDLKADTDGNFYCGTDASSAAGDTTLLDIVNTSMLDNKSIIRTVNSSWAIETVNDSISSYYNHSIDLSGYISDASLYILGTDFNMGNISNYTQYTDVEEFDNITIIRTVNSSWAIETVNNSISSYYNHSIENLHLFAFSDSPVFTTAFTATGLVSQTDLDLTDITIADFTNDALFTSNDTDVKFNMVNVTQNITMHTNNSIFYASEETMSTRRTYANDTCVIIEGPTSELVIC